MARDLGYRLKQHFYTLLYNNLRNEIAYQIEDVWGAYFDSLVVAQDNAAKAQQRALEEAQAAQDEYQRKVERNFAVFNFFCGLSLAWLGAQLQYRVGPSYFRRKDWFDGFDAEGKYASKVVDSEDKVAAKLFGDVGKDVAGALVNLGLPGLRNPQKFTGPDARRLANSVTLEELRKSLKDEITKQKNKALGAVEEIANSIFNDPDYGDRLVEVLIEEYPDFASQPANMQEAKGYEVINRWLNAQRTEWAKKWAYYGNDPPQKKDSVLAHHMERELWALWLMEHRKLIYKNLTDINAERLPWFDSIIDHMFDLNLPVMNIILRRGKNREGDIDRFINWGWRHKPEDPLGDSVGKTRTLTPIEAWTRPH
jgi:hypothetical protein